MNAENTHAPVGAPPFVDTPVLQAKRRAFDSPTQAHLDALINAVRQETLAAQLADLRGERDEALKALQTWRGWAQFVYLGGGSVTLPDDALRAAVNQKHDDETQPLKTEVEALRAERDALQQQLKDARQEALISRNDRRMAEADLARLRSRGQALVQQWREKGAVIDTYHATMGMGWKACADALTTALSERGHVDGHADTKETP